MLSFGLAITGVTRGGLRAEAWPHSVALVSGQHPSPAQPRRPGVLTRAFAAVPSPASAATGACGVDVVRQRPGRAVEKRPTFRHRASMQQCTQVVASARRGATLMER